MNIMHQAGQPDIFSKPCHVNCLSEAALLFAFSTDKKNGIGHLSDNVFEGLYEQIIAFQGG